MGDFARIDLIEQGLENNQLGDAGSIYIRLKGGINRVYFNDGVAEVVWRGLQCRTRVCGVAGSAPNKR